ncbi:putative sugar phosphate/phosphate translocator [Canna indica]|uniref:Sugar phosphate/phosphate translocator n=1 Tax=Canna indica TaxID=4628 RepID=A0AAQ3KR63_9LILI|nr:putative sugar phosphate/phosphate translocator [Canna indica]
METLLESVNSWPARSPAPPVSDRNKLLAFLDAPTPPCSPLRRKKRNRSVIEGSSSQPADFLVGGVTIAPVGMMESRSLVIPSGGGGTESLRKELAARSSEVKPLKMALESKTDEVNQLTARVKEVENQYMIAHVELTKLRQDLAMAVAKNIDLQVETERVQAKVHGFNSAAVKVYDTGLFKALEQAQLLALGVDFLEVDPSKEVKDGVLVVPVPEGEVSAHPKKDLSEKAALLLLTVRLRIRDLSPWSLSPHRRSTDCHRRLQRGSILGRHDLARRRCLRGHPPHPLKILLTSKGISLNPITLLYYIAPCCMAVCLVPWALVEIPILRDKAPFYPDIIVFSTHSFCTFALNLVVFLLVGKTSALTINVVGVVKDWLLIDFSWSVICDTITTINLLGYGVAFLDVVYYNHAKLHALKAKELQRKTQQDDEESGRLL